MMAVGACAKPSAVLQGPVDAFCASTGPSASTASCVDLPLFGRFSRVGGGRSNMGPTANHNEAEAGGREWRNGPTERATQKGPRI
jgi:hypothetical protein